MPRKLKNSELDRKSVTDFKKAEKTPLIVVLDQVRSLNNVGAVFRSADAFLIKEIILCGITATPPHKDITKTALGATETVDWTYSENTLDSIEALKSKGVITCAVEQAERSIALDEFNPQSGRTYALVFGHEVKGVSQDVVNACEHVIEIPQLGTKHSLNIAVSAGVVLWDFFSKIRALSGR
ncbi:RNA methyltransferase [Croceiramulus getboli]|nr:RNA methyltransferase [Flavobacteriaceae bacterium YJPT1-3]